jgi:hypothetical protein
MRDKNVKKFLITLNPKEMEYLQVLKEYIIATSYQEVVFFLTRKLILDPIYRKNFFKFFSNVVKSKKDENRNKNKIYRFTVYLSAKELDALEKILEIGKFKRYGVQNLLRELIYFEGSKYESNSKES